jgi:hypothetical protein
MKAKLIFDLNEFEDRMDYERVNKSLDMVNALWNFLYNSKKQLLVDVENEDVDKFDAVELTYGRLFELLEEHDVNVNKLVF